MARVSSAALTLLRHQDEPGLLLWALDDRRIPGILRSPFLRGHHHVTADLLVADEDGELAMTSITGWWLPAPEASAALAPLPLAVVDRLPASIAVWSLASKWVVEAIARHQVVPGLVARKDDPSRVEARWRVAPVRPDDRTRLAGLASAIPGACRAWVHEGRVLTSRAALRMFTDAAADGLLRATSEETAPMPGRGPAWIERLGHALAGPDASYPLQGLRERHLPRALDHWTAPATSIGGGGRPLAGFRLEEPTGVRGKWRITYHLLDGTGEIRVAAADLQSEDPAVREKIARLRQPGEALLRALGRCARVFPPIARSLTELHPIEVKIDAEEAWNFLTRAALKLQRAGYWVDVPSGLSRVGRRRVRARMRVGVDVDDQQSSGLLQGLIAYSWEASLGDDTLTAEEFKKLAAQKAPLVLHRGKWVAVDPDEVARLIHLMEEGGGELRPAEAMRLVLAGEVVLPDQVEDMAEVVGEGAVADALVSLREGISGAVPELEPPVGLALPLRPYQVRGLSWLESVTSTGFGACLADDMGLGKTIEVLAHFQHIAEDGSRKRYFLVVCPTSVLGNWRREIERFTPRLGVIVHHGPARAAHATALRQQMKQRDCPGVVVITSYALVRRDIDLFRRLNFDVLALDEAQNIKNPDAAQSRAVRELQGRRRVAMTGTPVENRLTELWSIMDFLSPGLLGGRSAFKRRFAIPVERYGDREAADQLRRVTAPFVLRRMKSDPTIAGDLPEKAEAVRYCPLTREQASLYQATLDHAMNEIGGMDQGMERRGRILAMLTGLKQICNHPAHYLRDGRVDPLRSGKLTRFLELLSEVRDGGGHALVFTQYREMGHLLKQVLERRLRTMVPFYHGGLARTQRDRLVAEFQEPFGPPLMIVSLKAGGTGLTLTRANHVFHYDRWWNPAVEDQATDRAFRIGQTRDVTVHRLVCQGTLEEQIHQILEDKRSLADRVIGAGETWLSELDDDTLHELVSLGQDAVLDDEEGP